MVKRGKKITPDNELPDELPIKGLPISGKGKISNPDDEKPTEGLQLSGEEIRERLLEAGSEEELSGIKRVLEMEGANPSSIRTQVLRLKKKGKLIFQTAVTPYGDGKQLAVEAIIHDMKLPAIVVGGGREIFDAGVDYGMRALVAGVRLAQELSQMGIAQASPVIRMATEMRKAEGMSAQEAGQVAAENALAGAIQYLSQQQPKADIATVPNPMQGMLARMVEQMFSRMFGMGQPQDGQQQPGGISLPPGWQMGEQGGGSGPEGE